MQQITFKMLKHNIGCVKIYIFEQKKKHNVE